jgi:hypothetical protein
MFTPRAALIAAFALLPLPAFADESPPAAGSTGSFHAIVCDTSEQIVAIVDAAKAKPDGGAQAKFNEFAALKDAKAEPSCALQPIMGVTVGESIDLGKAQLVPDKWVHAWSVAIHAGDTDGFILYVTPTTAPASLYAPTLLPNGLRAI